MAYLEMKNICKCFPGVVANQDVCFTVEQGEIHALLGENGAGKSTLMNILFGLYQQDEGEVFIEGRKVNIRSPKEAIDLGIGMVHQHFMLVRAHTVIENVILGMKQNKHLLDLNKAAKHVQALASKYKISIDPFAKVWQLSVGEQQRLEIVKALYRGAGLLILDEPTAVLAPQEAQELFDTIRQLSNEGHTVIFITHKLDEVLQICDRCTVLRNGCLEAVMRVDEIIDKQQLCNLMVGKNVELTTHKGLVEPGEIVLHVEKLNASNDKGLPALKDVSFRIREGEILGVAGVDGNGQSELVECLTGLRKASSGEIFINGAKTTGMDTRQILELNVSHIPEDRHKRGMVADMSIRENLIMMTYYQDPYCKKGFLNWKHINAHSHELCEQFDVRTPSIEETAGKLSGGNQQKFVVARELDRSPKLLVAMHPGRGLDIGATKYIQTRILEERDKGTATLLVSTELDEVMELSDRIMVMYEGQIMAIFSQQEADRERIGMLMAGVKE
ncbi:MAG: ABC transporter ATP-binding protein [Candidatus Hydrogenedentes bacterium]|nr:ABC transporter ATP-binding protein [Candidatus Hydrogenedentota bacterium]